MDRHPCGLGEVSDGLRRVSHGIGKDKWSPEGVRWSWDSVRWSRECVCVCLGSFYIKQGSNNKKKIKIKFKSDGWVLDMSQICPRYVPDMF